MSQLTKMMTMFLAKAPTGEPMGAVKNINAEDRGGGHEKKINPLATLCKICGKVVMHNKAMCWEMEVNAATIPPGWPFKK